MLNGKICYDDTVISQLCCQNGMILDAFHKHPDLCLELCFICIIEENWIRVIKEATSFDDLNTKNGKRNKFKKLK